MNYSESKKTTLPWIWIGVGVVVLIGIIVFSMNISYNNTEVSLMNEYQAQEKKIEAVHDNMWKVLQQKAGVTKEYSAQFDSIYSHIMDARYEKNDGVLFNWIKESNPEFSQDLYKDLSISIEVQRKKFLSAQEKMIDISREYNNLISKIPAKWFLGGKTKLDYEVISSSRSKDVMQTRQDDDTELF